MTVSVLFFGHYSDIQGGEPQTVILSDGVTVRDLARVLAVQDARLAGIEAHCRFAVNEEYANLDQTLQPNDVVAVLPPMSGG